MPFHRLLTAAAIGSVVLCVLAFAYPPERRSPDAMRRELIINARGTTISVAPSFLPEEDRGTYVDARTHDVVRLRFEWPSMQPYREDESLPPRVRYRDKLSASIAPSGRTNAADRRAHLRKLQGTFSVNHVPNSGLFGLERTSLREGIGSSLYENDVLVHFGSVDTMITCSPERDPDPGTAAARQLEAAGHLLRTPDCTQIFFVPELPNAFIRVWYQRVHLKDWAAIQERISNFIRAAIAAGRTSRNSSSAK